MKASLLITNGDYQVLLAPDNDTEKSILKAMKERKFTAHESDFEIDLCKGGYYRTFNNSYGASHDPRQLALVSDPADNKPNEQE